MSSQLPTSQLFVDGTNLDHRLEAGIGSQDVNFSLFFQEIASVTQTKLTHTHYFTAPYVKSDEPRRLGIRARQIRSLNRLRNMKEVSVHTLGRHQRREEYCPHCRRPMIGYDEKGTDVHAAALLLQAAFRRTANRLIFLANDNDYVPAFEICRELGMPVTLIYVAPNEVSHRLVGQLRRAAGEAHHIDAKFMSNLWLCHP